MGQSMKEYEEKHGDDNRKVVEIGYNDGPVSVGEWRASHWFRVIDKNTGKLWCETSNLQEALESMGDEHILCELHEKKDVQWKYRTKGKQGQ